MRREPLAQRYQVGPELAVAAFVRVRADRVRLEGGATPEPHPLPAPASSGDVGAVELKIAIGLLAAAVIAALMGAW